MAPRVHDQEQDDRLDRAGRGLNRPARGGDCNQFAPHPRDSDWTRSISDLVGGRVLAWVGGAATLLGIVLFLAVAISRGWLGVEVRVALAGLASGALMAAGIGLRSRRGRTEASVVLVGVGTSGLFATLVVASEVYGLISPLLAVGGSMLVGALATALAVRWAGRAIGALGLLGALVSPVLVGAPLTATTVAIVGAATCCAMWLVVAQRWGWLGVPAVLAAAGQWGTWILRGQPLPATLAVLVCFSAIGLAGAAGASARPGTGRVALSPLLLAALNACLVGALGWMALDRVAGQVAGDLWLGALAAAHLTLGLWRTGSPSISEPLRRLLVVTGVALADVAFGLGVGGIGLAIGWAAAAVGFAWLTRRSPAGERDRVLIGIGVGAHIALTLIRVLLLAPPTDLVSGGAGLMPLLAIATLAACCLACGQLISDSPGRLDVGCNALGLAAVAYLTAQALSGPALVIAWAMEGAALAQLARPSADPVARYGGLGFLALAAIHAGIFEAPPTALVTGASSLGAAALGLGAISLASLRAGQTQPEGSGSRLGLLAGGAGALLYLGSVAIITAFQPVGGGQETLLALSVRQQGQVLLSTCWGLIGFVGLIAGLRLNWPLVRNAALGLLLFTVGKVFLYDLSTLTSLYRVISVIALGLLLLAGAFAYQRLRPPPVPDMRDVHPSQR